MSISEDQAVAADISVLDDLLVETNEFLDDSDGQLDEDTSVSIENVLQSLESVMLMVEDEHEDSCLPDGHLGDIEPQKPGCDRELTLDEPRSNDQDQTLQEVHEKNAIQLGALESECASTLAAPTDEEQVLRTLVQEEEGVHVSSGSREESNVVETDDIIESECASSTAIPTNQEYVLRKLVQGEEGVHLSTGSREESTAVDTVQEEKGENLPSVSHEESTAVDTGDITHIPAAGCDDSPSPREPGAIMASAVQDGDLSACTTGFQPVQDTESRRSSSSGSFEAVPLPPSDYQPQDLPPPSPMRVSSEDHFCFSGSLVASTRLDAGEDAEDDSDSEEESENSENEQDGTVPLPLDLKTPTGDDDEELEVDPVVADEILTSRSNTTAKKNPLLDALVQIETSSKQFGLDVSEAQTSKVEEISMFDSTDGIEVRVARTVFLANADSSEMMFGIGYQSLRKGRSTSQSDGRGSHAYELSKSANIQDLEGELMLADDLSQSLGRKKTTLDEDEDEFEDILTANDDPASPTRIVCVLLKTRASLQARSSVDDNAMVSELKEATELEKRHLATTEAVQPVDATSTATDNNTLTLKELHGIYKRGLGDQEVLLLDEDTKNKDGDTASPSTLPPAPSLSLMGRILSKQTILQQAIREDEEGEEEEEDGEKDGSVDRRGSQNGNFVHHHESDRASIDDDDAHAVSVDPDRVDVRAGPPANGTDPDEWREIQLLRKVSSAGLDLSVARESKSVISYADALRYFLESDDILVHRDKIVVEELAPATSCFGCLSRPRLTFPGAVDERDRFFCTASTRFDPRNAVHVSMLQTIHRKIVGNGSCGDVPLIGGHWEGIGFQGSDPATDLRGCGVLSLFQLLHLVETQPELARRFHSASQHAVRHFPMACAAINVTLQCLIATRSGTLFRECNKCKSIFAAANTLHTALVAKLTTELPTRTEQIPLVMKSVLDTGRLHPDRMIDEFASSPAVAPPVGSTPPQHQPARQGRESHRKSSAAARSSHGQEFTEIGLQSVGDA